MRAFFKIEKIRIYFYTIIISYFVLLSNASGQTLSIESSKTIYASGEPVLVSVTIKNDTDTVIKMPLLFICEDYYLRFVIKDENGAIVKFTGVEKDWLESELDILRMYPNSTYSQVIDLRTYYRLNPGKYSVYAIYEVTKNRRSEENVWNGKLVSKTINLKIR